MSTSVRKYHIQGGALEKLLIISNMILFVGYIFLPSFSCGPSGYKTSSITTHSIVSILGRHRHRL